MHDQMLEDWDDDWNNFRGRCQDEGRDGHGVNFKADDLELETPRRAIRVEDAVAKDVMHSEEVMKLPFWVVVKVGLEDVFDVGRVSDEDEGEKGIGEGGAETT